MLSTNAHRANGYPRARRCQARRVQLWIQIAEVRKAGCEAEHINLVNRRGVQGADLLNPQLFQLRHALKVQPVVNDRDFFHWRLGQTRRRCSFELRHPFRHGSRLIARLVRIEFKQQCRVRGYEFNEPRRRPALQLSYERAAFRESLIANPVSKLHEPCVWAVRDAMHTWMMRSLRRRAIFFELQFNRSSSVSGATVLPAQHTVPRDNKLTQHSRPL